MKYFVSVFKQVFGNYFYLIFAVGFTFFTLAVSVWLRNFSMLTAIFGSSRISFSDKILLFVKLLFNVGIGIDLFSLFFLLVLSILSGFNAALIVYFFVRQKKIYAKQGVAASSGILIGLLGTGCAACGTFVLSSLLASFGAAGAIVSFPFGGEELSVLGIFLLLSSIFLLLKEIKSRNICILEI